MVLLLGYTSGIRSSRKLEAACSDIVAFRWLAGGQVPGYRAIAKFRKPGFRSSWTFGRLMGPDS